MEAALRPLAGAQHLVENARGARAGLGHVDVRIGAVGDQRVGALEHRARHVRVQVEARDDRHARADGLAHAAQDLALAVVVGLHHHRAVQVEVDAIDGLGLFQSLISSPVMRSKASAVTCAEGLAAPQAVPTRLCPSARSAWIAPAAGMFAPSTAPKMGSPYCTPGQPPPASNAA